jgi:16S rRNA processing protein RimM
VEAELRKREDGKVVVGRLGAPRGISGDLRVQSYSGETAHILSLKNVELVREREGLPETRLHLKVSRAEEGPGGLTLAFEGYATPEKATVLAGMEILVDRGAGAPLRDNEWYTADLIGLRLVAPGGATVYGLVKAVCEGGPDPWLEIELGREERPLVPFRKEFIGGIDLAAGTIELLAPWILE